MEIKSLKTGIYKHYKGDLYLVLFQAFMSDNDKPRDPYVVYISMAHHTINVRRTEEFIELVDHEGEKVARFTFIEED